MQITDAVELYYVPVRLTVYVPAFGISIGVIAFCAFLRWIASNLIPPPFKGFLPFWDRVRIAATIIAIALVFGNVFAFGAWLTSPTFPIGQKFIAVSLNGVSIIRPKDSNKLPTFEVRWIPDQGIWTARGTSHCNWWIGRVRLPPLNIVVWDYLYQTALGCKGNDLERKFLSALYGARQWRTQDGFLIMENGTDVLRFARASN